MLRRLPADGRLVCHTHTHTHLHLPLGSDLLAIPVMLLLRQTGFVVLPSGGVMLFGVTVECVCVSVLVSLCESLFQSTAFFRLRIF